MNVQEMLACFFGGALLTNALPHYVAGLQGKPLQSPFANPPGKGLSTSRTNVLWGFANLFFAYFVLKEVAKFDLNNPVHAIAAGVGSLAIALLTSHRFGPINGGDLKDKKST